MGEEKKNKKNEELKSLVKVLRNLVELRKLIFKFVMEKLRYDLIYFV